MSDTKRASYEQLSRRLAPRWEQDALMSERHPETWQKARDLDDLLVAQRDDDTVTPGTYRLKCMDLLKLYETEQPVQGAA